MSGCPNWSSVQASSAGRFRTAAARLAQATGRKPGNLSRTLKTMSHYGIVEMQRGNNTVRPVAKATVFRIVAS